MSSGSLYVKEATLSSLSQLPLEMAALLVIAVFVLVALCSSSSAIGPRLNTRRGTQKIGVKSSKCGVCNALASVVSSTAFDKDAAERPCFKGADIAKDFQSSGEFKPAPE